MNTPKETNKVSLLAALNMWGLSFGCAVGWGAFMMPGNLFLPHAGPVGSIVAIVLGGLAMLIITANFCALARRYGDDGGFFAYARRLMGYDHAFLVAWAIIITYLAILWANSTAVVLFIRYVLGDVLQWGYLYRVAGFEVYCGEIIATWAVIIIFGLFSAYGGKVKRLSNTLMALLLIGGMTVLFCGVLSMNQQSGSFLPAFAPVFGVTPFWQIISIFMVTPWMFFGYESISHGNDVLAFSPRYWFPVLIATIFTTILAYCMPIVITVVGIPPEYSGWNHYINAIGSLDGLKALPTFYSVNHLLGSSGTAILGATILAGITTSIIGLYRGSSSLLQIMAQDNLLPKAIAESADDGTPRKAIFMIMGISLFIPLLGRTAIVWLVDAITISGAIAYAYMSLCRYRDAKEHHDDMGIIMGFFGFVISIFFFFFPVLPDLMPGSSLNTESYLLLSVWSVVGLIYYWYIFRYDKEERFGKSFSMCTVLLFLNFFTMSLWLRQVIVTNIPLIQQEGYAAFHEAWNLSNIIQIFLIILVLIFMADIFTTMHRREYALNLKVRDEQVTSLARNAFLTNITHDIGLMIQSIMSYVKMCKNVGQEYKAIHGKCPEDSLNSLWQALRHIDSVSHYFIHLTREMELIDRIKTDSPTINPVAIDLRFKLQQIKDIFSIQMEDKGVNFQIYTSQVENYYVYCDNNRLQRMLLNLISLAYDFTPSGGNILVSLTQSGLAYRKTEQNGDCNYSMACADYELHIQHTGASITKEFIDDAYTNYRKLELMNIDKPEQNIAITKHLVQLINGTIEIESDQEKGTDITIRFTLNLAKQSAVTDVYDEAALMYQ